MDAKILDRLKKIEEDYASLNKKHMSLHNRIEPFLRVHDITYEYLKESMTLLAHIVNLNSPENVKTDKIAYSKYIARSTRDLIDRMKSIIDINTTLNNEKLQLTYEYSPEDIVPTLAIKLSQSLECLYKTLSKQNRKVVSGILDPIVNEVGGSCTLVGKITDVKHRNITLFKILKCLNVIEGSILFNLSNKKIIKSKASDSFIGTLLELKTIITKLYIQCNGNPLTIHNLL